MPPLPVCTGATGNPLLKPEISSVMVLDDEGKKRSLEHIQYVNIKRVPKYLDPPTIQHKTQMSRYLTCKVEFNMKGAHNFKLQLVPDREENIDYSGGEQGRNDNFKYEEQILSLTTDADGTKVFEGMFVNAAGGNSFRLVATDVDGQQKSVSSLKIKTKRLLYLLEIRMVGLDSLVNDISSFKRVYSDNHILFKDLPRMQIPRIPNVPRDEESPEMIRLSASVESTYQYSEGPNKDPYCIAMVVVDQLVEKAPNKQVEKHNVQIGNTIPIIVEIKDEKRLYELWNNIVFGEDWFVDCYFVENGIIDNLSHDMFNKKTLTISRDKITLSNPKGSNRSVIIDVSSFPPKIGTIYLKVNCVKYWRGGSSIPHTNIVLVASNFKWRQFDSLEQNKILIHEVGHNIGMVADEKTTGLNLVTTFYVGKGHNGNHCYAGVGRKEKYNSDDSKKSSCVMFGDLGVEKNTNLSFCEECAKAVRKLDLVEGVKRNEVK